MDVYTHFKCVQLSFYTGVTMLSYMLHTLKTEMLQI